MKCFLLFVFIFSFTFSFYSQAGNCFSVNPPEIKKNTLPKELTRVCFELQNREIFIAANSYSDQINYFIDDRVQNFVVEHQGQSYNVAARDLVDRAMTTWHRMLSFSGQRLSFARVRDRGAANFIITMRRADPSSLDTLGITSLISPPNRLSTVLTMFFNPYTALAGEGHLQYYYSGGIAGALNGVFYSTILHEIGHGLELDHTDHQYSTDSVLVREGSARNASFPIMGASSDGYNEGMYNYLGRQITLNDIEPASQEVLALRVLNSYCISNRSRTSYLSGECALLARDFEPEYISLILSNPYMSPMLYAILNSNK